MNVPRIVIRGRVERGEFKKPFRQCIEMLERVGVPYALNPTITDEPLDFALFFQSYPYEFIPADLTRLRSKYPFAPFFFVLGACCEGMLRTVGPLDSPFYCYVHGWNGKAIEQIRWFLTDQPSMFSLPLTAENDEMVQWLNPVDKDGRRQTTGDETADGRPQTAADASGAEAPLLRSAVCGLPSFMPSLILTRYGPFGNDSAMNLLIADEQARLGREPIFSGKTLPVAFAGSIFADVDDSPLEKILESIQRLRHRFADNDFTVYVDSPRIDEKNGYMRAGVTRILPKMR